MYRFSRFVLGLVASTLAMSLVASGAHADNLRSDLDAVLSEDQKSINLGSVVAGSAQSVPVLVYLQSTGSNNTTLPISVTGSGNLGSSMTAVSITDYGKANGVTGNITFNAPVAQATQQSYTINFVFATTAENVNELPAEVTISFSVPAASSTPTPVAPSVTYTLDPSVNGSNGWYKTGPVTLTWTVSGSPAPVLDGCVDRTISSDQVMTTYACSATNSEGTASNSVEIGLDATAPTVTVTGVQDGATYILGSVPAAGCATTDVTSGVATPATLATTGGPVGSVTSSCSGALDNAGSSGQASATYQVIYDWDGFFQPVDNPSTDLTVKNWNRAKAGSAIPLKFTLGGDQGLGIIDGGAPRIVQVACPNSSLDGSPIEETVNAANSGLKYDVGQYIYVWKTNTTFANKCFRLDLKLVDGTTHSAFFNFVK